jgi:hypothetical protein
VPRGILPVRRRPHAPPPHAIRAMHTAQIFPLSGFITHHAAFIIRSAGVPLLCEQWSLNEFTPPWLRGSSFSNLKSQIRPAARCHRRSFPPWLRGRRLPSTPTGLHLPAQGCPGKAGATLGTLTPRPPNPNGVAPVFSAQALQDCLPPSPINFPRSTRPHAGRTTPSSCIIPDRSPTSTVHVTASDCDVHVRWLNNVAAPISAVRLSLPRSP